MIPRALEPRVKLHEFALAHALAWAPMEKWEREGKLPDFRKCGEDTWEDQIVRRKYMCIYIYIYVYIYINEYEQ